MKTSDAIPCFALPALLAAAPLAAAQGTLWHDTFYQYRIPVVVSVDQPGWHVLPIDEARITAAVNQLEELKYRDKSFAYNYVKCVAEDETGNATPGELEAGFYLVETGPDLAAGWNRALKATNAANPMFEVGGLPPPLREGDSIAIAVKPSALYLLRYLTSGASSPAHRYEPIHPEGSKLNKYSYRISYEPRLLPLAETLHETLIQPGDDRMDLVVGGRFVNTPKTMSVRQARILMLANIRQPGRQRLTLYYQPMGTHFLMVPDKRRAAIPEVTARLDSFGPAQKYEGQTRHLLTRDDRVGVWFAAPTVKLTPNTPMPERVDPTLRLAAARNERMSFQIVLTPRRAWRFQGLSGTSLTMGTNTIAADRVTVRAVDYVPIRKTSQVTPTSFQGWIGDPLVPVAPRLLTPEEGNLGFWITVDVGTDTAAGTYQGKVRVDGAEGQGFDLPVELTVRTFALPEYSPLQIDMGGQFFVKGAPGASQIRYHGVTAAADLRKLADDHYEVMARNKFTPKNVALYTPIGLKWDPPPEGLNVDKPGNFFRLYDWDFTEFNAQMEHFVGRLKVNQVCIYHSNPLALNIFMHLPGPALTNLAVSTPFVTYAWQTFREATFVGYDIDAKHSYRKLAKDITRNQYDRLVLDFFRAIAGNLEKHGWLRFAVIMIDENHNDARLKHFLRLLKSDPLTARIKVGVCVQGLSYFSDPEYNGLLDYYAPQLDEGYNRWESFYFTDYGIKPDRSTLWNYIVTSSRLAIDAPGINNREIGLDLWKRGAGGYLCWDTFIYKHAYGDYEGPHGASGNPWLDPFTRPGNGALSFFYPPRRDGTFPEKPDFTVTPSLRMEIHREAVNDYEYAWLLEQLVEKADRRGIDTGKGRKVFRDIGRFFHNANLWSQNDAWFLELRARLAEAIVELEDALK